MQLAQSYLRLATPLKREARARRADWSFGQGLLIVLIVCMCVLQDLLAAQSFGVLFFPILQSLPIDDDDE